MNQHNVHLFGLPNEILFFILKKLNNIDVLYSLLGIGNRRLDIIAQDQIFTNILDFVFISQSTNQISSISGSIIDRFCVDILPRIHENVQSLIVDSVSIGCILGADNYPNLTELKLFNFNKAIVAQYFMDDSVFKHNYKKQITDLTLISNENNIEITPEEYIKNIYAIILVLFENVKHLNIVVASTENYLESFDGYPRRLLYILLPITFSSSTLTKLCITANDFNEVYALLDGRLKQLTTFIVQVGFISEPISTSYNRNDLRNLKCFSLTCYRVTAEYDITIPPLLRRMSHLEELSLFLHLLNISTFISGTHLDNEILIHMPRLHTFTFYIGSKNDVDPAVHVCGDDIEQTFTNIKYGQVGCMVDYFYQCYMVHRVFSLPTRFNRLTHITNNIPNIVFNSVTDLKLQDRIPFKQEFFIRLARAFPFLKNLSITNIWSPFSSLHDQKLCDKTWCSIIEYSHLMFLDVKSAHSDYLEQFLNGKKTYLPCITKLKVAYNALKMVTENFTKDEMRRNCSRMEQLIIERPIVYSENIYLYFPFLRI